MKLTPIDIQQMKFKVSMRGYDRREVDRFLEELSRTVEELNRDNASLREKLASVERQGAELKKAEATLMQTLVSTQSLVEELKRNAHQEAELIIKEAEVKAGELMRDARLEVTAARKDVSELRKERLLAIERLRSTLRTFERVLEIEEAVDDQPSSSNEAERIAGRSNR